jgi:hypothetical protein
MRLIHTLAAVALIATTAWAGDVKVIANSSVGAESISAADLKGVFLGTKTALADGSRVEPVLVKSGPAHDAFLKEYLGKTDAALQTYYRSLVFTGRGAMPKTVGGEADVIGYVAKTKGAVGYVSDGTTAPGTKTLSVK